MNKHQISFLLPAIFAFALGTYSVAGHLAKIAKINNGIEAKVIQNADLDGNNFISSDERKKFYSKIAKENNAYVLEDNRSLKFRYGSGSKIPRIESTKWILNYKPSK